MKLSKSLLIFLILCLPSPVLAQDMVIKNFHSDIVVSEDSSFTVTEKIAVEFLRARHGIFREIPYKFRNELGKTIKTPMRVISVTDQNGKKQRYKIEKDFWSLKIRIGDPDIFVEGFNEYHITYRVKNAITFFKDHDELFWNVTGNFWDAPIEKASASVVLPFKEEETLEGTCYTGRLGSNESAC